MREVISQWWAIYIDYKGSFNCSLFFQVQSIVGSRLVKGLAEYKVRWKNFSSQHDSWLEAKDLHCPELLEKYKNSLGAKDEEEDEEDFQVCNK